MARVGAAAARLGPGRSEDRPTPRSAAQGAALPGDRAGVEVSKVNTAWCARKTPPDCGQSSVRSPENYWLSVSDGSWPSAIIIRQDGKRAASPHPHSSL